MELWKAILLDNANTDVGDFKSDVYEKIEEILQSKCFLCLNEIKQILEDDNLTDEECFLKIEKIICLFEKFGAFEGGRHDF